MNSTVCAGYQEYLGPDNMWFWIYLSLYIVLTMLSGLFSGLTSSFFALDVAKLRVTTEGSMTARQRVYAARILPLVRRPYLLLVTLNSANVSAIVAMPILLNAIVHPALSIVISAFTVLIFNKLLPQSVSDRHGLALAANTIWVTYIVLVLFFVIAWPISRLLRLILGKRRDVFYQRSELKALMELQMMSPDAVAENRNLTQDEVIIIKGALDAESKVAKDAMIPLDDVFMLNYDGALDRTTMDKITSQSYSHVPVFKGDRQNIQGEFVVKNLIILDPDDRVSISSALELYGRRLPSVVASRPLYHILDEMNAGKYRVAAVHDASRRIVGILAMQNVLDEILGQRRSAPSDGDPGEYSTTPRLSLVPSTQLLPLTREGAVDQAATGGTSVADAAATNKHFRGPEPVGEGEGRTSGYVPNPSVHHLSKMGETQHKSVKLLLSECARSQLKITTTHSRVEVMRAAAHTPYAAAIATNQALPSANRCCIDGLGARSATGAFYVLVLSTQIGTRSLPSLPGYGSMADRSS
ncbi:uncharacterized protein [Diadema antillarum]|uniref:uncharacterized protein n=1 Tax=Diadema antillarum TaxID=105358 RepID=UPI003A876C1C